jgi:hypothetical protein
MAQGIEESAFASVGVAHQGYHGNAAFLALAAVQSTVLAHLVYFRLEPFDPITYKASVSFYLGFAWPPGADASPQPLQVAPLPGQTGQEVLMLRQFHLKLSLLGLGSPSEDVQYQGSAVYHFYLEGIFQIPLLRRGEFVIEDDKIVPRLQSDELLDLALTYVVTGRGVVQPLHHCADNLCSSGGSKLG